MEPKHDGGPPAASHTAAADGSLPGHDMPMAQQGMEMRRQSVTGDDHGMNKHHQDSDTNHQSADKNHSGMPGREHGHGGMMEMSGPGRRFFISLALAVPILLLSPMMGFSLPFHITFPGQEWLVLALGSILYFYGGAPFLRGAAGELKAKSPAMMTLIALGITTAYVYSLYATLMNRFGHGPHVMDFFWELATLIVIMLLGHWIEMRAVQSAGDALQSMAKLLPAEAAQLQADGSVRTVPLAEVKTGARLLVKPGAKMPADGVILAGESSIDESLITGEAAGVAKKVGDAVIGGSQNGNGSLTIRVSATGESGYLAQVMQLVKGAQQEKSHAETLADKVAKWLFYVALTAGLLAFIVWLAVTGSFADALTRMVTVLVIACPHALGLAIPLVSARSTSLGAKNGLLVRRRPALEAARKLDTVLLDKTGTLTEGRFSVRQIAALAPGYTQEAILAAAAALEQGANHPLAAGILRAAEEKALPIKPAANIQNLPGSGLAGILADGTHAKIVSPRYLHAQHITYDADIVDALLADGATASMLLLQGQPAGIITQQDSLKPTAAKTIGALLRRGLTPVLLTGDNEASAAAAARLGLREYHAQLLPQDKERLVREYRAAGHAVMMVGDGVNDAPALARANVGVAIGAGTDVAISSADVVLVKSDPADILHFLSLAQNTTRKMRQNLFWGAGYNVIAIPLAAGVLAPLGILLSPAVGAVLMSLSTVIVALNALTLKIE